MGVEPLVDLFIHVLDRVVAELGDERAAVGRALAGRVGVPLPLLVGVAFAFTDGGDLPLGLGLALGRVVG